MADIATGMGRVLRQEASLSLSHSNFPTHCVLYIPLTLLTGSFCNLRLIVFLASYKVNLF